MSIISYNLEETQVNYPPTLPIHIKKKPCVFEEGPYCTHYVCVHQEEVRVAKAEGRNTDMMFCPLTRTYRTICLQGDPTSYCCHPKCLKDRFKNGVPNDARVSLNPIVYVDGIPRVVRAIF